MIINASTLMHFIEVMGVVSSLHVASAASPWNTSNKQNNGNSNGNNGIGNGFGLGGKDSVVVGEAKCVIQCIDSNTMIDEAAEDVIDPNDPSSFTVCEMEPGYEDGYRGITYDLVESSLPHDFYEGVECSETLVTVSEAVVAKKRGKGGGSLSVKPGATVTKEKKEKKDKPVKGNNLRGKGKSNPIPFGDRSLKAAQKTGDSSLIVLYAIPLDASNGKHTSVQLANEIFGINTTEVQDAVNVKTQMLACSGGQLNYVAACGPEDSTCNNELVTNGILEVPINENITGVKSGTVKNWVMAEAQVLLNDTGTDLFSFEQIMLVIPDEASWGSAAAWAYRPGYISAFRDNYAYRVGTQVHEFGHNLGLTHSGYNGASYKDHSDSMGNPSYGDDGPEVCFNGAKSWELGWYQADSVSVDPLLGSVSVDLVGVGDWADGLYTSGEHKVVLEIQVEDSQTCGSYSAKQADYRGTVNVTASGKTCMTWSSQSPHSHSFTPAAYPDSGLDENFCRNPDGEDFAWCYTTDPDTRWEYCDVPLCPSASQKPYLIYNRAKGGNSGVSFAKDEVTVTLGGAGTGTSWHQASLGAPDPANNAFPLWRQPNYNHGTKDLVVKVCSMTNGDGSTAPDTASILVYTDDGPGLNNGVMCPGEVSCISDSQCDDGNYCTENKCDLESNTCMPPVDISATLCPTCGEQTFCNPLGFCHDVCHDGKSCTSDSCADPILGVCQHDPIPGCAVPGATLETWFNLDGSKIEHLTRSMSFRDDSPDEVLTLRDDLKSEPSRGSKYGARLETYIHPSVSGIYNLYVASDDYSELYLSTDDDPENKSLIAHVNGYTQLDNFVQKTSQKSSNIYLEAGTSYYLEAYHKEGGGGDHLSIAWESLDAGVPLQVVDDLHFFLEPPVPCTLDEDCISLVTNPCTYGRCSASSCEYVPINDCQNGGILDIWSGISGSRVNDLTSDSQFPDSPSSTIILGESLDAPSNAGDQFGSRLQTYIMAEYTCDYNLYIACNERCELNLSTDEDPENKSTVAFLDSKTNSQEWHKYASQKSAPIPLVKGQLYYLEALHKDGSGSDNLSIGWECIKYDLSVDVIDASYTAISPPLPLDLTPSPSTSPSAAPSSNPTRSPTNQPTSSPSKMPSQSPSSVPSKQPSNVPSASPSKGPSMSPSKAPSNEPTSTPSQAPSKGPSVSPSKEPTSTPSQSPSSSPSKVPSVSPSKDPSSNPSTSPSTEAPSKAPITNELVIAGDNGSPAEAFPLKECQGDCDYDSNCEGDLLCYQRMGADQEVPGCVGSGDGKKDYCAVRATDDTLFLRKRSDNMSVCDGNCQEDTDCTGNAVCELPNVNGEVEGCIGLAISSVKYCKYPTLSLSTAFPLGVCEGSCTHDGECEGSLECFLRVDTEDVPGCLGSGISGDGYCTTRPSSNYLWTKAAEDSSPLGVCEGNCNSDDDCDTNLICEMRSGDELVPGCDGSGRFGTNYCRYPSLEKLGNNPSVILGLCQGDCDSDDDCEAGLRCYQRNYKEEVIGCAGGSLPPYYTDYCAYRPTETTLFLAGNGAGLGMCEGDCDNDDECLGELTCFSRGGLQEVPGCEGLGASGKDYCH